MCLLASFDCLQLRKTLILKAADKWVYPVVMKAQHKVIEHHHSQGHHPNNTSNLLISPELESFTHGSEADLLLIRLHLDTVPGLVEVE
jgi:hypothetical protein